MYQEMGMPALKGLGNLSAIFRVAVMVVEEAAKAAVPDLRMDPTVRPSISAAAVGMHRVAERLF